MANPTIASASILQSGQVLYVIPLKADGSFALHAISAVADGASITIDGVTTALSNPFWSDGCEGFFYPLSPAVLMQTIDDHDAGWSPTGSWAEVVPSNGVGGYFDGGDAKNAQFHTSTSGTCTWAFTGLTPGRYRLSAHIWGLVGPDRTADALYTLADGAGTTLGAFHLDQQTPRYPEFDRVDAGLVLHDVGTVTLGAGQSAIDVVLSNAAGAGLIVADSLVLRRIHDPAATPGQVVTATFPAGTATVGGAPTDAATDLPVSFLTDAEFLPAIPDVADTPRTIKVGYNLGATREDWFPMTLADRGWGCDPWVGDVTLDAHYEMVGNTGSVRRTMLFYANGDGTTPWGSYLLEPGTIKVKFTAAGTGTWDDAARANVYLANWQGQYVFSNYRWTDLGSNEWLMEVDMARGAWAPVATRTAPFFPSWTSGISFHADNVPGVLFQNWRWFDARTPADYAGTAHPADVARLRPNGAGWAGAIRSLDVLGANNSTVALVGDFPDPADRISIVAGGANPPEVKYVVAKANVVSVAPVDLDSATDASHFFRYFDSSTLNGWLEVVVDSTAPFVGRDGTQVTWLGPVNSYPSTLGGSLQASNNQQIYVIDGTRLLMQCASNQGYPSGSRATVDNTYAVTGTTIEVSKCSAMPIEWFLRYCSDVAAPPWLNIPHLASDDLARWIAQQILATTPDGVDVLIEYSNETWNFGFNQWGYFVSQAHYAAWQNQQDPANHPAIPGGPYGWQAYRASQIHQILRQAYSAAGRDPNLIVRLVGAQTQNSGSTAAISDAVVALGLTFDMLILENYQNLGPVGSDPAYVAADGNLAASFGRLDADGVLDVLFAATFRGTRPSMLENHRNTMAQHGWTSPPPIGYYEGSWAYIAEEYARSYADQVLLSSDMMASPRMFRASAAEEAYSQSMGVAIATRYTWAYYSIPPSNIAWSDLYSSYEMAGTGSPTENTNRAYYPTKVSEPYGGRMAYATGASFAATPTPTPTPTTTPTTTPTPTPTPTTTPTPTPTATYVYLAIGVGPGYLVLSSPRVN